MGWEGSGVSVSVSVAAAAVHAALGVSTSIDTCLLILRALDVGECTGVCSVSSSEVSLEGFAWVDPGTGLRFRSRRGARPSSSHIIGVTVPEAPRSGSITYKCRWGHTNHLLKGNNNNNATSSGAIRAWLRSRVPLLVPGIFCGVILLIFFGVVGGVVNVSCALLSSLVSDISPSVSRGSLIAGTTMVGRLSRMGPLNDVWILLCKAVMVLVPSSLAACSAEEPLANMFAALKVRLYADIHFG